MSVFKNKIHIFYFAIIFCLSLFTSSCRSNKNFASTEKRTEEKSGSTKNIEKKYAALLSVTENNISNTALYSFIDEWYGVPYKYGGKDKKGIDCSNFTSTLYKNIYHKALTGSSSSIFTQCKEVPKKDLKEGDLVFFKIEKDDISHIGIYLQNNKFVHATTKKGVMINDLDEAYYKKYFYKAGRLKN